MNLRTHALCAITGSIIKKDNVSNAKVDTRMQTSVAAFASTPGTTSGTQCMTHACSVQWTVMSAELRANAVTLTRLMI